MLPQEAILKGKAAAKQPVVVEGGKERIQQLDELKKMTVQKKEIGKFMLQRQAASLQHASVSYTMYSPGSYQSPVYNGFKMPSSYALGTPLVCTKRKIHTGTLKLNSSMFDSSAKVFSVLAQHRWLFSDDRQD
ncbi:unnamed protein product [Coregonus sp. 'balchen']|nr:unnamed protein product [Coregonus sp. 'balchen']